MGKVPGWDVGPESCRKTCWVFHVRNGWAGGETGGSHWGLSLGDGWKDKAVGSAEEGGKEGIEKKEKRDWRKEEQGLTQEVKEQVHP